MRMRLAVLVVALLALAAPGRAAVEPPAAFEKLKSLAGAWDAKVASMEGGATISYRVTAGGHAVMETLFEGSPHEMVSVYYLDGKDLVMTHYCAAGNRPQMKLDTGASTDDKLVFAFAGGTGFKPSRDMHVHQGWIDLSTPGAVEAGWGFWSEGKPQGEHRFSATRR